MKNNFTYLYPLNTPVLFLIFNRLNTTKQVFKQIRKTKPSRLYITAGDLRENIPRGVKKLRNQCKNLFREKNSISIEF